MRSTSSPLCFIRLLLEKGERKSALWPDYEIWPKFREALNRQTPVGNCQKFILISQGEYPSLNFYAWRLINMDSHNDSTRAAAEKWRNTKLLRASNIGGVWIWCINLHSKPKQIFSKIYSFGVYTDHNTTYWPNEVLFEVNKKYQFLQMAQFYRAQAKRE